MPRLEVVQGKAPDALTTLDPPDAVFVGGGVGTPGLVDTCWEALHTGGRLVANTVTLEGEVIVTQARAQRGGTLTRLELSHAEPLGGFTGWQAQRPVVQWAVAKA